MPLAPMALHAGRGISLVRGEGFEVWDAAGRRYLDAFTNYGVNILGHANPAVVTAVAGQMRVLGNAHQSFGTPARDAFVAALAAVIPPELEAVSFANSGAEALEAALKYARVATARTGVIAMEGGYHGRTMGALSVTSAERYRAPFEPLLPGVRRVPFDDPDAVADILDEQVAAVVVEPIQGEAGVRVPGGAYLRSLRRLCDAQGALLVLDEVQTGFRTGAPLCGVAMGVVPDILCLAKGIANGIPLGVTLTTASVARRVPRGSHGSTFAGSPVACAAGAAVLRLLADPQLHSRVAERGRVLAERLGEVPGTVTVRGRGLMIAVDLDGAAMPVLKQLQVNGVLALPGGPATIRLLPPVIIDDGYVDELVRSVATSVDQTRRRRPGRDPFPGRSGGGDSGGRPRR